MSRFHPATRTAPVAFAAALLFTAACNSASTPSSSSEPAGSVVARPDGSGFFIADENRRGLSPELHLVDVRWGRLVDVFGLDAAGERVRMQTDFLIPGAFVPSAGSTQLETSPVTGEQSLIVLRDVTSTGPGGGREQFFDVLRGLDEGLARVPDVGLGAGALLTMIPRNATVMLRFDDLLDPNTIDATTVQVAVGVPALETFEARILADPNHGGTHDRDGDGRAELYPTRVFVDPTVSEVEAFAGGLALQINRSGFPESLDATRPNLALRVPTVLFPAGGQTLLLQNLTAHVLSPTGNGTIDFTSPTRDVTRLARSGGMQATLGDPFNGFLPDAVAPRVIGTLQADIDDVPQQIGDADSIEFRVPRLTFDSAYCSKALAAGDVIRQGEVIAEVVAGTLTPSGGVLNDVRVQLRAFPPSFTGPADWILNATGPATVFTPYDPLRDAGKEACFVQISPTASGAPEAPATGVASESTYTFLFSEPMQRTSLSAFDALRLTRQAQPQRASDWAIGELDVSLDLTEISFLPTLPLAHQFGQSESYFLALSTDGLPPTDLAGNPVAAGIPAIELVLRSEETTRRNGGRVLRFDRVDEEEPFGNVAAGEPVQPEFFGQHTYDLARQTLRPRPVTRFEAVVDRTQPAPAAMTTFSFGSQEPLSPLGSRMQTMWRSIDFNFAMEDSTMFNIDVEGMNWAPNGLPSTDHFDRFEIRLSHSRFLPDEYACAGILRFPTSGVGRRFQENTLSLTEDPQKVVHPASSGYSINPGDLFAASTGTPMMPFPVNRNVAPGQERTYTWRDTSLRARGGETTSGAPTFTEFLTRNEPFANCEPEDPGTFGLAYPPPSTSTEPVNIRSIALPLLVEFRCYPDDGASGLNTFDVSIARNLNISPGLRAHSSGGVNASGDERRINPDTETTARGGFDHISTPSGQPTSPTDNIVYMGSLDLVVRVSRSHSVWFLANQPFDAQAPFSNPRYALPVVEPHFQDQPDGTRLELAFRGATAVGEDERSSALMLDAYGDHYGSPFHSVASANASVAFVDGDDWRIPAAGGANPLGIDGAQYYQVRATFFADIHSGNRPELATLAVGWHD